MQSSEKAYFAGALGVLFSRGVSVGAGVLSLWFLTRILSVEEFAAYNFAMSIAVLLGYSIGLGTERSLLIRINETDPHPTHFLGMRLMKRVLALALALSAVAVSLMLVLPGLGDDPRYAAVPILSLTVPALAGSLVLITWYQANHRVGVSQSMQGLNDGTRCLFFGLTLAFGLGWSGIGFGAFLGAAVPALYLSWRARGRTLPEPSHFGLRDALEGLPFVTMRVMQIALQELAIIALGSWGSATGTSQFTVAVRVAILIESGQMVFAPTFMPRVLRHLAGGRKDLAAREYRVARLAGFLAALAAAIVLVVIGAPVLNFLSADYGVDFPAFLILIAAYLLPVGMGMHSTFLSMTDKIALSSANRVVSIAVLAVLLWILVPRYDAIGASVALLVAVIVHEVIGVLLYIRHAGTRPFGAFDGAAVLGACTTLCATAAGLVTMPVGAAVLAGILAVNAIRERVLILQVAGQLLAILRPGN